MNLTVFVGVVSFCTWFIGIYTSSICLSTLGAYYSFPSLHDASHGSAPDWLGHLSSLALLVPFPEFRKLHRLHHAHTNDATKDPDYITHRNPLSWFFIPEVYVFHYLPGSMQGVMRYLCVVFGVILYTCIYGLRAGIYLVVPSRLAFTALVVLLDVVPHVDRPTRPAQTTKDFYKKAPWWFFVLTAGQCYHEMHHKNPKIPWSKLGPTVQKLRPAE